MGRGTASGDGHGVLMTVGQWRVRAVLDHHSQAMMIPAAALRRFDR
jgi:hypothetical protein